MTIAATDVDEAAALLQNTLAEVKRSSSARNTWSNA